MTTFTIYANANDHYVQSQSSVYSTARSGGGTKTDNSAGTSLFVGQMDAGGPDYSIYQAFLSFDTSSVPDVPLTSVTLSMNLGSYSSVNSQIDVAERSWVGGTSDFVAGASLSGLTAFGSRSFTNGEAAGYKDFTGTATIPRSSTYRLIVYPHNQQTNTAPGSSTVERGIFSSADTAGTTSDPKLVVVLFYKVTAETGSYTLTGLPAALVYSKRLIAEAASFILTGIAAALGIRRFPPQSRTIVFDKSSLSEGRTLEL